LPGGKKSWLKIRPAAVPYRKKSYHSMVAPIALANPTFLIEVSRPASSPPSRSTILIRVPPRSMDPLFTFSTKSVYKAEKIPPGVHGVKVAPVNFS